jgi:hypothetical protein
MNVGMNSVVCIVFQMSHYYNLMKNNIFDPTRVKLYLKIGDVIRVLVNMELRTLAFEKNGVYMGVSHRNLPDTGVYPAFSLYNNYDKVTILDCGMY